LPVRQAQSGTLVELAADALQHRFEIGQAGHVAQSVALIGLVRGAERPLERCTLGIRLRPYPVLGPMPAYAARRPVPGLPLLCASSTPGPNRLGMRGFSGMGLPKGFRQADKRAG
jgi:hypothetical protein